MTAELEPAAIGRFGRRYPTMAIGGALLGLVVLASLLAPALTSYDPLKPSFSQRLAPPWGLGGTPGHVLGTDNLGRDILARLLYGGRISLALAVSAVLIAGEGLHNVLPFSRNGRVAWTYAANSAHDNTTTVSGAITQSGSTYHLKSRRNR